MANVNDQTIKYFQEKEKKERESKVKDYVNYIQGKCFKQLNLYDLSYLQSYFPYIYKRITRDKEEKIQDFKHWFNLERNKNKEVQKNIPD